MRPARSEDRRGSQYRLAKPGRRKLSVGEHELVGKVGRKGFAFVGLAEATVAVKCAPTAEHATELRERYPEDVRSTGYVGRYGWDTVTLGGAVPAGELRELLGASYAAAVSKLPQIEASLSVA
jgi:predicted DNA-binding protein (MmcQ/YjbR family)